ncbi:serine/threonine-protein kinase [Luteimonas aquatica]|uniref:serine/threonine-protein kinase n=1 Tax=Luteimonas aquatica TaxID=450364 RepID=UPI001F578C38|nr:serine/threonine-protein kinase [Luteimonas aquatica]
MSVTADPERWRRLSALFDQALDLPPEERARWLPDACGGDAALRADLQRMLAADASANLFDQGASDLLQASLAHGIDEDDDAPAPGDRAGSWRLERVLGRGGMGTVYAALRDEGDTPQRAALKRLHRRWDGSLQAQRFLQERRILASLSHPNLPRLIDHGLDDDGRPWFALEYVDGGTLVDWADAHRLGLRARIELFRTVCAAVQHAHEHFVVHRDLKPANILVDGEGHPKVLDFGVAKRIDDSPGTTRTGLFAGFTPEYAAPEQISGGTISAATDVYALGVVLYQLLAGRLPYRIGQDNLREAAEAIVTRHAERMEKALAAGTREEIGARLAQRDTSSVAFRRFVRGDLTRIVQTALAKEPSRRYASVAAFSTDLGRFLAGRTVSVGGDTFAYRAGKFVTRNRWGVAMAGLAGLALAFGVGGILVQTREARAQAARAALETARAEKETARAKLEVERMDASNEFMRNVFSTAAPGVSGNPDISLREALDLALSQLDSASNPNQDPQLRVRFRLAAANSYAALGEDAKAEALTREALKIQETQLADSKEDRARALAMLAWLRMSYEPANSLAWAKEAVKLHLASDPVSDTGLQEAYSVLSIAQYRADDIAAAIETSQKLRRLMRERGIPEDHVDMITAYSNEAVYLRALSRFDEAAAAHEAVIRLRARSVGADTVATWEERMYYGDTLNRAERYRDALAQFRIARPGLRRVLGDGHETTQLANQGMAQALIGLGRYADALPLLAATHAYGRDHGFRNRQGKVAYYAILANARLDKCREATALLQEARQRKLVLPETLADPVAGTRCRSASTLAAIGTPP